MYLANWRVGIYAADFELCRNWFRYRSRLRTATQVTTRGCLGLRGIWGGGPRPEACL